MSNQDFFKSMRTIQTYILDDLENIQNPIKENYEKVTKFILDVIGHDSDRIKSILYMISHISNNHHRTPDFFNKIFRIILLLKQEIKSNLSNNTIFNIFQRNKRVLLFLFDEDILTIDDNLLSKFSNKKYIQYHYNEYFNKEVLSFHKKSVNNEMDGEEEDNYEDLRRIGENEKYICELIRNDLIKEFIIYVNKNNIPLNTKIHTSIYETNKFLIKNTPTLIEYSAFFGSIEIFQYLNLNNVELSPMLWLYAIHGSNEEIIHLVEDLHIMPKDKTFLKCLKESIKCHHNNIAEYIINNYIQESICIDMDKNIKDNLYSYCFHYYNYKFFPEDYNATFLFYACKYDYLDFVKYLLNSENVDINKIQYEIRISEIIFIKFKFYHIYSISTINFK